MNQSVLVVVGKGDAVLRAVALAAKTHVAVNDHELKKGAFCAPLVLLLSNTQNSNFVLSA